MSKLNYEVINDRVQHCNHHHPQCKASLSGKRFHDHHQWTSLPKRLVDVGLGGYEESAKLVSTEGLRGQYIALSYCWKPGSVPEVMLTKQNLDRLHRGIQLARAPKTARDAISVVRNLGYRYIWVDSLCIIQDDNEDKQSELPRMGDIYMRALFVIAALGARDYDEGLFPPREDQVVTLPIKDNNPEGASMQGSLQISLPFPDERMSDFEFEVSESRWQIRGWVFQERELARRIVYFGRLGLYWKCRYEGPGDRRSSMRPSVIDLLGAARGGTFGDVSDQLPWSVRTSFSLVEKGFHLVAPILERMPRIGHHVQEIRTESKERQERDLLRAWKDIIFEDSACELTQATDVFAALGGITDILRRISGWRFYYGL